MNSTKHKKLLHGCATGRIIWAYIAVVFTCMAILLPSCRRAQHADVAAPAAYTKTGSLKVKYAKGFTVDYYDSFKVISVIDLKDPTKTRGRFVLYNPLKPAPAGFKNAVLIPQPAGKIACVSTTTIGELVALNLIDSIAAVTNAGLIYNHDVAEKLKQKQIADIGTQEVNYEKLIELQPDFVFTSGGYDGGDILKNKLTMLHITNVPDLEYREQDPLGRAEWIKFVAAFYNRESYADSIFDSVETHYNYLKHLASAATQQPAVFCNLPFKEIWYMPCGENYMARLIEDAGGNFLWKNEIATNGLNLNLDYEAVFNKAANADIWLNPGIAASMQDISNADSKNKLFKAYKTGSIYNINKRVTAEGGFDFWESGTVRPDEVLADLLTIFHPGLLKNHELYYYQNLK